MQLSERSEIILSGLSNPTLLSYPPFLNWEQFKLAANNKVIYIINDYCIEGLSLLIKLCGDDVMINIGDFNGNKLDLDSNIDNKLEILSFLNQYLNLLIKSMSLINIDQAIFYFSYTNSYQLVDVRTSLNKLCGPGMINDLFSKIVPTQKIIKITQFDDKFLELLQSLDKPLVLKTSTFQTVEFEQSLYPIYTKISYEDFSS